MLIIVWSSDECSSDLQRPQILQLPEREAEPFCRESGPGLGIQGLVDDLLREVQRVVEKGERKRGHQQQQKLFALAVPEYEPVNRRFHVDRSGGCRSRVVCGQSPRRSTVERLKRLRFRGRYACGIVGARRCSRLHLSAATVARGPMSQPRRDRKSTRLNSSHDTTGLGHLPRCRAIAPPPVANR